VDWIVGELPLHPLLVHLTVVLVPVSALTVVLAAVWPAARRRMGLLPPILALLALIAVPITTSAGTWLAERVGRTPLVDRHELLGSSVLPWTIAVFVVAAAVWAWHRFFAAPGRPRLIVSVVLAVAAVIVAVGSIVLIVQIGESGASAVWTGNFSESPIPAP
jgi:uncharacterized membrane protein